MDDNNNRDSPTKTPNSKVKKWVLVGSIPIILILILLIALNSMGYFSPVEDTTENSPVIIGANVKEGLPEETEASEEQDNSMISVQLDAYPVFEDGASEGSLNIVNPATNSINLEVEITLDDTGEVIYNSGGIPPNSYIDNDKLLMVLEKGEYYATASVRAYDPENPGEEFNQAEFSLLITILN